jgi:recombination protein RecT
MCKKIVYTKKQADFLDSPDFANHDTLIDKKLLELSKQEKKMNTSISNPKKKVNEILQAPDVRKKFEDMLGKKAAGFISSVIAACSSNTALAHCDQMSIVNAAALAASMDLPINASLGFAYIVPYKGVGQFQIGWKGFIQLAQRTGLYHKIEITDVLEGQIIAHNRFTGDFVFGPETSQKIVGFMLYFRLKNGFEKYFYMTKPECLAHGEKYSQSFSNEKSRWKLDEDPMCRKTVAKMGLSKFGPLSIDLQRAIEADQAVIDADGHALAYPDAIDITSKYDVPEPSETLFGCEICGLQITADVNAAAMKTFGKSLCMEHQNEKKS